MNEDNISFHRDSCISTHLRAATIFPILFRVFAVLFLWLRVLVGVRLWQAVAAAIAVVIGIDVAVASVAACRQTNE